MLNTLFNYYYFSMAGFADTFLLLSPLLFSFLLKGADGEDGLPGELGKVGPPVCNVTPLFQYILMKYLNKNLKCLSLVLL